MRSALRDRFSKEWFAKEGVCASVLGVDGAVNWLLKQKEFNDDDDRKQVNEFELLSITPFDYCLRIAANVIPNPINESMQKYFFREGERGRASSEEKFFVAHLPRADELDWQNEDCVSIMAGADRIKDGLPGHVLIVPKNGSKHWKFGNITLFLFHARKGREEKMAIEFLERLRKSCVRYAFNRGWTRIGIYFRPWGNDANNNNNDNRNEGIEKIMRAHVVNLVRAGPGLSNTRWKNLTLDDAIEVLGGKRRCASGRAIDVKQEYKKNEILDIEHRIEVEEQEPRSSLLLTPSPSPPTKKVDRQVNTERQLRSRQTQVSEEDYDVAVEDATMFFESSEGKSYVHLSNDAERKALELLCLY